MRALAVIDEILEGFSERVQRLAAFAPIFQLDQQRSYPYDLKMVGVCLLLYILEDMLQGNQGSTYEGMAQFTRELINRQYGDSLTTDEAMELTRYVVDSLRNDGRPFQFPYPDFEKGRQETLKFQLIAYDDYSVQDRLVRLKLTDTALELLFQTREVYRELRLSIMQLYLRQQILRGVFDGALRTVNELQLEVRMLQGRIREVKENILRDVIQTTRREEHLRLFDRIQEQLGREKRLFTELEGLVQNALAQWQGRELTPKEQEAMEKIVQIQQRLNRAVAEHDRLFTGKLEVRQQVGNALESAIITAFSTKLNFEREVLEPVLRNGINLDRLKKVIDPVLPLHSRSWFNPELAFLPQTLLREGEEQNDEEAIQELEQKYLVQELERERREQVEREARFEFFLRTLLAPLLQEQEVRLSRVLEHLKLEQPEQYDRLIGALDFYPFMVQLHQMEVVHLRCRSELGFQLLDELPLVITRLCEAEPSIRQLDAFYVRADDGVIRLENGYVLSDFTIRRAEHAVQQRNH